MYKRQVSQPIPGATHEILAAAIEDCYPINAKDRVRVDGSALEDVAPEHAGMTAEEPVVVPALSNDQPLSAAEVVGDVQDAEESHPIPAASKDTAVAAIKDNSSIVDLAGASVEQPASEIAVQECISPGATEGATNPVSCGTTESMIMVADGAVDVPTPVVGDETLVAVIEDSVPNVVPGESSAHEPVPITLAQERMTPAAEELVADPVSDDPTTSAKETPTTEAVDTSQRIPITVEDTRVVALEESADAAVRDGESAGEPAAIASLPECVTLAAEGPIARMIPTNSISAAAEASGIVKAAEFAKPTSLASEETLVVETEDNTATNTIVQDAVDGPASMIPAPENITPGAEVPDDTSLAGMGGPRAVDDTGVCLLYTSPSPRD